MGVSFPYTGSLFFLSFLAWVPLLLLEEIIAKRRFRSRKIFVHAYVAFFVYNLVTTWWIYFASAGGAAMALFANSLVMVLPIYAYHLTKKYVGRKEGYLSLPIYWIGFEYLHLQWDLSWPWLQFGNAFSRVPELVQWYNYTGVMGGTLWILLVNLLLYRICQNVFLRKEKWRIQTPLFFIAGLFLIVPVTYSLIQYSIPTFHKGGTIGVQVVQPNIDPYNQKFTESMPEQLDRIFQLVDTTKLAQTDLILAPETALAYEFYESDLPGYDFYPMLRDSVLKWKTNLLIGASTREQFEKKQSAASRPYTGGPGFYESYNSSLFVNSEAEHRFVHKSKLVLGVEKIPFLKYLPFLDQLAIDLDGASGTLGVETTPQVIETDRFRFAPVICYESIYGEFVAEQCQKGANFIAIITNDGWWKDTPGYKQHMSFARLRAIENEKYVVRCANTGTSGVINEKGDVILSTAWWVPTSFHARIRPNSTKTFYSLHGDLIGRSFGWVSVLLLLFTFVKRFKEKIGLQASKEKRVI